MFLLLTGGTGFFGKALLRHWLECVSRGEASPLIMVLSRSPERFLAGHPEFRSCPWLRFHHGDILDPSTLPANPGFTHILHAAADSTLGARLTPIEQYAQIADGTRNLLDYATTNRIPRFLLTSSGGVYGPQPQDMAQIPEDYNGMPDPLNPHHAYSVAKRCAEHLCTLYRDRYGLETVIARCFAFVGRDLPLDAHFAIGNFIRDALAASEITVQGDGTAVRSYMDQRDLAHWLSTLLQKGSAGQAYNVGSDVAITIRDLANLVRDVLAPEKAVRVANQIATESFRHRYVPCITKAHKDLSLGTSFTLTESVQEAARRVPS